MLPVLHRAIDCARGHSRAVGREQHTVDSVGMAFKRLKKRIPFRKKLCSHFEVCRSMRAKGPFETYLRLD